MYVVLLVLFLTAFLIFFLFTARSIMCVNEKQSTVNNYYWPLSLRPGIIFLIFQQRKHIHVEVTKEFSKTCTLECLPLSSAVQYCIVVYRFNNACTVAMRYVYDCLLIDKLVMNQYN